MFPDLPEDELDELAESILRDGQQEPAVIHAGQLLDGKNRMAACERAGKPLRVTPLEPGVDPVQFVLQRNLLRRNLSVSQRAAIGVQIKEWCATEAKKRMKAGKAADPSANLREGGKASEQSAKMVKTSPRTIEAAAKVKDESPALFEQVAAGAITVNAALEQLPKRKTRAPKHKATKSTAGLVLVLNDEVANVRHPTKFYNRRTYPNILYFQLWNQSTFEFQCKGWSGYDVLYSVLGFEDKVIEQSGVPVCKSSARFLTLSFRGNIPAPVIVPNQVIEGGVLGVIRALEQAWPDARKILLANPTTAPEKWELLKGAR